MSTKPAPRCPGCGKEMELRWQSYYGGMASMWYACDCGWSSPNGDDEIEAYDKAMKRYEPEHAAGQWISVKDKMPDKAGSYLVCIGTSVFVANYMPAHCAYSRCVEAGFYTDLFGFAALSNVTHWMDKPAPPKEDVSHEQ